MVCGIDVGLNGAIAFLSKDKQIAYRMPLLGKDLNIHRFVELLNEYKPELVIIEHQQAFPKQGVVGVFRLGYHYGALSSAIIVAGYPIQTVRPKLWKDRVLKGTKKDKAAAIKYVMRKYPNLELVGYEKRRKKEIPDGVADAICIAEYGLKEIWG